MTRYLVLDLDSTLIYAQAVERVTHLKDNEFCFRVNPGKNFFKVTIRKHLETFIKTILSKGYRIIVWSAGSENYVKNVTSYLFRNIPLEHVLTFNHLTDESVKIMETLKNYIPEIDLDHVRLLDDNRIHQSGQEKHFVYIKPFKGEQDDELMNAIQHIDRSYDS